MLEYSMTNDSLLAKLSEEYIGEIRCGKSPDLHAYVAQYPNLAQDIKELFPTLWILESMAVKEEPPKEDRRSILTPGTILG